MSCDCELDAPTPRTKTNQEATQEKTTAKKKRIWFEPEPPEVIDLESGSGKAHERIRCEAIGCDTTHSGREAMTKHMRRNHTYFVEIFYTCPVNGCPSRYQAKHLLLDHYEREHFPDSNYTIQLHENNQIYGYYASSPLNTELVFCPLCAKQGRGATLLKGLTLLTHLQKEHGYVKCGINNKKCNTFTNFKAGYMQHVRIDHSVFAEESSNRSSSATFTCAEVNCRQNFPTQVALNLHAHKHEPKPVSVKRNKYSRF